MGQLNRKSSISIRSMNTVINRMELESTCKSIPNKSYVSLKVEAKN